MFPVFFLSFCFLRGKAYQICSDQDFVTNHPKPKVGAHLCSFLVLSITQPHTIHKHWVFSLISSSQRFISTLLAVCGGPA